MKANIHIEKNDANDVTKPTLYIIAFIFITAGGTIIGGKDAFALFLILFGLWMIIEALKWKKKA